MSCFGCKYCIKFVDDCYYCMICQEIKVNGNNIIFTYDRITEDFFNKHCIWFKSKEIENA